MTGFLVWHILETRHTQRKLVRNDAWTNFNKDQAFRFWAASHGGVYVPATEKTPPNPFLSHIPERDIKTPSGRELTLINPAYMLRQTMEEYANLYGVRGHLTSLKHFRPETAPDEWEKSALKEFERGKQDVFEFTKIEGKPYFRLMSAMIAKEKCLKCHGHQGYKAGDIRGGISVSVPMAPYLATQRRQIANHVISNGLLWLLGIFGISVAARRLRLHIGERNKAEGELRKRTNDLGERIKELNCLYGASKLIAQPDKPMDEIMGEIVLLIPPAWQYPEVTCARIIVDKQEFITSNFRKTEWKQCANIMASGEIMGSVEIYYLEEMPIVDEGPFLTEERELIDDLARQIGVFIEHKRVEELIKKAEQRYRKLFEGAPVMYVVTRDQNGIPIIADCNNSFLITLRYARDEVLGQPLADFYTDLSRHELFEGGGYQKALDGPFVGQERQLVTSSNEVIETLLNTLPETDSKGLTIGTRVMYVNVTERKKAQKELDKHKAHLEEMVQDRTAELQRMVNLMAGRETRMAELKETIRKLHAQMESAGQVPVADDPLKGMLKESAVDRK